ncbi:ATP-binding protein [Streptomyces sp. NPDC091377]|uniref:ATP-binding protein n=1 Tax=Streptomyces sp. NPDC091377 TaxID=3365995 RepID=UPI003813822B
MVSYRRPFARRSARHRTASSAGIPGVTPGPVWSGLRPTVLAAGAAGAAVVSSAWAAHAAGVLPGWVLAPAAGVVWGCCALVCDRSALRSARRLRREQLEEGQRSDEWLSHFSSLAEEFSSSVRAAVDPAGRGGARGAAPQGMCLRPQDGKWTAVDHVLHSSHGLALSALAARRQSGDDVTQVFVLLAGNLFTLVVRALEIVEAREATMEDPEALYDLLDVDSLLRRIRRQAARFAVLGGTTARRFDTPTPLLNVLRAAAGEIERYDATRIVTPAPDTRPDFRPGSGAPDVIHLLAELMENATQASPPRHEVSVSASEVAAGLLIEIVDRGLGMTDEQLDHSNRMLASPAEQDVPERLARRQTGLLVAARLAARYRIQVRLDRNWYAGTTASVIVPRGLLQQHRADPPRPDLALRQAASPVLRPVPAAGEPRPGAPEGGRPLLPRRTPRTGERAPAAHTQAPEAEGAVAAGPVPDPSPDFFANFTNGTSADASAAPSPAETDH